MYCAEGIACYTHGTRWAYHTLCNCYLYLVGEAHMHAATETCAIISTYDNRPPHSSELCYLL